MPHNSKPKIIILMHYLELGGAEISLIGLLHALDPKKVDVDLFIYDHRGWLMEYIPKWVNLLPSIKEYTYIERPLLETIKKGHLGIACGRLYAKYKHRNFLRNHQNDDIYSSLIQYVGDCVTPFLPKINPSVEYDACISFLTPHNYAIEKVRAKKYIAWIHTDYLTVNIDVESELKVWEKYDNIVSISSDVSNSFLQTFPSLEAKIIEIENILPIHYVKKRAKEFSLDQDFGKDSHLIYR